MKKSILLSLICVFLLNNVCAQIQDTSSVPKLSDVSEDTLSKKELHKLKVAKRNFHYNILGGPSFSPDFGFLVGGSALMTFRMNPKDTTMRRSVVPAAMAFLFNGGLNIQVKPQLFFKDDRFRIFGQFTYKNTQENFYGIGYSTNKNYTRSDTTSQYRYSGIQINPWFLFRIKDTDFFIGPQIDLNYDKISNPAEYLVKQSDYKKAGGNVNGYKNFSSGIGFLLTYDTRDIPANPYQGIYLDFRGELSAFDKYFYFGDRPNTKTMQTKQDYIRRYSPYLKKAMDGHIQTSFKFRKKFKIKEIQPLTTDEITTVSSILGKQYDKIKIIIHSFYGQLGESVQFRQANLQSETFQGVYTEAFAGSGESAIVKLVHQIYNANKGALILLDEPEVSLHPSAQQQLIYFLLQKTLEKGLQVVFATHSPLMIEGLPKEAIVLLVQTPEGVFSPRCSVLPEFVFQDIGYNVEKPKILVEDKAAKELLESCLELYNSEAKKSMDIEFHAGGAEDIIKEIVMLSRLKNNKIYFILDGDKHYKNIPDEQTVASSELDSLLKEITGIDVKKLGFIADSGNAQLQLEDEKRNFLKYYSTHTYFLPKATPEEIMWEASQVEKPTYTTLDYKQRICEWVKNDIGNDVHSSDIDTYRKKLCHKLDKEHKDIKSLMNMLLTILDRQRND